MEPNGIHLPLPLTHRLLGELVGAERPSISHALARLGRAQLITGAAGDWHLVGSLSDHMEALNGRSSAGDSLEPSASSRRRPSAP